MCSRNGSYDNECVWRPCSTGCNDAEGPEGGVRTCQRAEVTQRRSVSALHCSRPVCAALLRQSHIGLRRFYQEQRAHDANTRALEAAGERAEWRQAAGIQARERQAAAVEEVLSLRLSQLSPARLERVFTTAGSQSRVDTNPWRANEHTYPIFAVREQARQVAHVAAQQICAQLEAEETAARDAHRRHQALKEAQRLRDQSAELRALQSTIKTAQARCCQR